MKNFFHKPNDPVMINMLKDAYIQLTEKQKEIIQNSKSLSQWWKDKFKSLPTAGGRRARSLRKNRRTKGKQTKGTRSKHTKRNKRSKHTKRKQTK